MVNVYKALGKRKLSIIPETAQDVIFEMYLGKYSLKRISSTMNIEYYSLIELIESRGIKITDKRLTSNRMSKEQTELSDKYISRLANHIIKVFPLKYIGHVLLDGSKIELKTHKDIETIYLCLDIIYYDILKVGQSASWENRIKVYKDTYQTKGLVCVMLFETDNMNKYEVEVREYLELMGYMLPWDDTNQRLRKIYKNNFNKII